MPTYKFVKLISKRIRYEAPNIYKEAILNSILYDTDMVGNIVVANSNSPKKKIKSYYKFGELGETTSGVSGFINGLPNSGIDKTFIGDIAKLKHQISIDTGIPQANITIKSSQVLDGSNISIRHAALSDVCNSTLINSTVIGMARIWHDIDSDHVTHTDVNGYSLLRDNYAIDVTANTTAGVDVDSPDIDSYFYEFNFQTTDPINSLSNSPNYFTYQYTKKSAYIDINNSLVFTTIIPLTTKTTQTTVIKPNPNDKIYQFIWTNSSYPDESIFGIYNVTATTYPVSNLHILPTSTGFKKAYPILQIRQNKVWYDSYLAANVKHNYDVAFKKLGMGKLSKFIDTITTTDPPGGTDPLIDIDDAFMLYGVDLYSSYDEDNEYVFHFFLDLLTTGAPLKSSYTVYDLNFYSLKESDYNQFTTFRQVIHDDLVPATLYDTNTNWKWEHKWEVNTAINGITSGVEVLTAPWARNLPQNDEPDLEAWKYAGISPITPDEQEAMKGYYEQIENVSGWSYIVEQKDPITLAVVQRITVVGIVQQAKLYVGTTDTSIWAEVIATPTNETNVQNELDGILNNTPYTGDQSSPVLIPIIEDVFTNRLHRKSKNKIASKGLFCQLYGSKSITVSFWKDFVGFLVEGFLFLATVYSVVTTGINILTAISSAGASALVYDLGMDWLKSALADILIKEVAGDDAEIANLVYNLYTGGFNDVISTGSFGSNDFFKLLDFTLAVIQVEYTKKLEDLSIDVSDLSDDELDDVEEQTTISRLKQVVLIETLEEFTKRTTDPTSLLEQFNIVDKAPTGEIKSIDIL